MFPGWKSPLTSNTRFAHVTMQPCLSLLLVFITSSLCQFKIRKYFIEINRNVGIDDIKEKNKYSYVNLYKFNYLITKQVIESITIFFFFLRDAKERKRGGKWWKRWESARKEKQEAWTNQIGEKK